MALLLHFLELSIAAINRRLRIILESTRYTVDTLNQILYDKTVDVGKTC